MTKRLSFARWSTLAAVLTLGTASWASAGHPHGGGGHSPAPTPAVVRVAAAQTQPVLFDNAANLADILAKIDTAADAGARLIVFPELALTGYKFKHIAEARPFAETIPGPATYAVTSRAIARNIYVAWGMLEKDGTELYNASVVVGPNGYLGKYRKSHGGYKSESKTFSRGDTGFPVFRTAIGRLGLGICYDANFPEAARVAALKGTDILVQPQTDGPTVWQELVLARTTENGFYAVAANRFGLERFNTFGGNSLIAGPDWTTIVRGNDTSNTIYYADLDMSKVDRSWISSGQPRLYRAISKPFTPQIFSIEYNPENQTFGTSETVVARIVTANVRENRRWKAELLSGGTSVVRTTGRTGPQGATIDMTLPADLPVGDYTLRVSVGVRDPLTIEAPFVVQAVGRPRAHGTRPTELPATVSGTLQVGFDRNVAPATGVPVLVTGGAVPLTFLGSVNTSVVDNRFGANYAGLATGTTYTATIAANKVFSLADGAGNDPITFQFTTVPAAPFSARVSVVQMDPVQGAIGDNLSSMLASVDAAATGGAKAVAFPELSLTGRGFASRAAARPFAETIPGASVDAMIARAQLRNIYVAFGMLEREADRCDDDDDDGEGHRRHRHGHRGHGWGHEHVYNTYVLVGPEGLVGKYRKAHLSAADALFADVGNGPLAAYDTTTMGKVGLSLSDSIHFPEVARSAAVQGATTILMGANLVGTTWTEVIRTRSAESRFHIAIANRIGSDGVITYDGRSLITTLSRTVLAQAAPNVAAMASANVNIESALEKRALGLLDQNTGKVRTVHYTFDRRPDLYELISSRFGWLGH
jgi:predicted amidohydrolase